MRRVVNAVPSVWSVCLSVTTTSCAKAAEPIETPFGAQTRVGTRNHVLDGCTRQGTIFFWGGEASFDPLYLSLSVFCDVYVPVALFFLFVFFLLCSVYLHCILPIMVIKKVKKDE